MRYFEVTLINDVISSIGPKFADCDTYNTYNTVHMQQLCFQKPLKEDKNMPFQSQTLP